MFPIEWRLVLAFLPLILLAFGSPASRRFWPQLSLLPALIALLQVVLEGWRWQFIPLDLLAAVIPVVALLRRDKRSPRRLRLVSGVALAGVVTGSGLLAGYLLPVITLPAPTGPYAVGVVDRDLLDPVRDRRLMATVWYPAAAPGDSAPLTHYPDQLMAGMKTLTRLPGIAFQHLRYIDVTASDSTPGLADGEPFPILVFAHGMTGMRLQNASMLQDLASWGYVVLVIDHTDAAAVTTFPDGETRLFDLTRFGLSPNEVSSAGGVEANVFPAWVADQQFAFTTLENWAASDPAFAGKLDMTKLGAFGHSFGGATSLEVCRIDPRCRAAADLDGSIYGDIAEAPATRPLLLITSASSGQNEAARAKWSAVVKRAQAPAT